MKKIPLISFVLGYVVNCIMAIPAALISPTPVLITLGLFAFGLFTPLLIERRFK